MMAVCGARVIVADIDADRARAVAQEIDGQPIALDVADPPSWDSLSLENPPTIALLNAGILSRAELPYEIHEVSRAEVTRTIGANFLGVLHGLRRLTPAMAAVGGCSDLPQRLAAPGCSPHRSTRSTPPPSMP